MGRSTFYLYIAQSSAFISFHLFFFSIVSNNMAVGGEVEIVTVAAFVLLSYNMIFVFAFKESRVKGKLMIYAIFSTMTIAIFANGIVWPMVRDEGYSVDVWLFTHHVRTFKFHKKMSPMALTIYGISMGFASFSMFSLILTEV